MKSKAVYVPLYDLDNPQPVREPRTARRKGLWIILVLSCVIALALAIPFYSGPAHDVITDWALNFKSKNVQKILKKADIIPDVIDDFTPSFALSVSWGEKNDIRASLGNTLKPEDLQDAPQVYLTDPPSLSFQRTQTNSLPINNLVIVATDPDAPSRKDNKWSEFCHWIAIGVPLVNISATFSPEAQRKKLAKPLSDIVSYKPPGPPPKTGKHRYLFLALSPKNSTNELLDLTEPSERRNWGTGVAGSGIKTWAKDMGLVPIAANFIYAKNKQQ